MNRDIEGLRAFFTYDKKVVAREKLAELLRERNGRKIVFTNGCFDILHIGHMRYLQAAKSLGDILVVAVNTDSSVKQLKGPSRPINSENNRAELLSGFECVDYVVLFPELTANATILMLKPEIYCKGGDYTVEEVPETPIVRSYGGDVCIIPLAATNTDSYSTTATIEKSSESLKIN